MISSPAHRRAAVDAVGCRVLGGRLLYANYTFSFVIDLFRGIEKIGNDLCFMWLQILTAKTVVAKKNYNTLLHYS